MLPPSHSPQPGIPSKTASPGSQAGRAELFRKVFKLVRPGAPVPSFQVDFYPFTGVRLGPLHLERLRRARRLQDQLTPYYEQTLEYAIENMEDTLDGGALAFGEQEKNSRERQKAEGDHTSGPRTSGGLPLAR